MGVWEYESLGVFVNMFLTEKYSDINLLTGFLAPILPYSHTLILSYLYSPILHMQHPVAHTSQRFVMGNDQKSLIEFFSEFEK